MQRTLLLPSWVSMTTLFQDCEHGEPTSGPSAWARGAAMPNMAAMPSNGPANIFLMRSPADQSTLELGLAVPASPAVLVDE
jgi:hypothetical protein